jgi:hypothetical protein
MTMHMKLNFLVLSSLLFAISINSFAEFVNVPVEDSLKYGEWAYSGEGTLNVNQGYLSNWVKGGESSINATWILNLSSNYKSDNTSWDNYAQWKYGVLKSGYESLKKNEDKFEFGSKFAAPFMTLAFMALLVIPELKIGDKGLFDVNKFQLTQLFQ